MSTRRRIRTRNSRNRKKAKRQWIAYIVILVVFFSAVIAIIMSKHGV